MAHWPEPEDTDLAEWRCGESCDTVTYFDDLPDGWGWADFGDGDVRAVCPDHIPERNSWDAGGSES